MIRGQGWFSPRPSLPTFGGSFYRSALYGLFSRINAYLLRWIRRKYERLRAFTKAKASWRRVIIACPKLFATGPVLVPLCLVIKTTRAGMSREAHVRIYPASPK